MDVRAVFVLWISCVIVCTADLEKKKTDLQSGGMKTVNKIQKQVEVFVEDEENYGALRVTSLADKDIEVPDTPAKRINTPGEGIYKQLTNKESINRRENTSSNTEDKGKFQNISNIYSENKEHRKNTTIEMDDNFIQTENGNFTSFDVSKEIQNPKHQNTIQRKSFDGDNDSNKKASGRNVKFVRRTSPKLDEELVRIAFQQELKNKLYMVEQENTKTIKKRSFDLWSILGLRKEEPKTVLKVTQEVPVVVPYTVEKKIAVPVRVEVERPVPVEVPRPYPIPVEKKVYYPVKEYVHAPYPVYKNIPYMVKMFVEKPVPVHVSQPYPVYVEKKIPYAVEKQIPIAIRVPVDRPYPVPVPVMKNVYYPVEKRVPYPVPVAVEKPVAVPVEKPYPVYIERQVPVQVEKEVPYAVPEPVEEHVLGDYGSKDFDNGGKSDAVLLEEQKNDFDGSIQLNDLRKADDGVVQLTNDPILRREENEKTSQKDVDEASKPLQEEKVEFSPQLPETPGSQVQKEDNIKLKDNDHEFGRKIKKASS